MSELGIPDVPLTEWLTRPPVWQSDTQGKEEPPADRMPGAGGDGRGDDDDDDDADADAAEAPVNPTQPPAPKTQQPPRRRTVGEPPATISDGTRQTPTHLK